MPKLAFLDTLPPAAQMTVAEQISDFSQGKHGEQPQMLPTEPQQIFDKQHTLVLLDENDQLAGSVSAENPIDFEGRFMTKVGTLWIPEAHRGKGNAHKLLAAITTMAILSHQQPYARVNSSSRHAFGNLGYTNAEPHQVPPVDRVASPEVHGDRFSQLVILSQMAIDQTLEEMFEARNM